MSNKVSFGRNGFKYFFGFQDGKKTRPLCVMLPKMSLMKLLNLRDFNETKYISFLIKNDELLEKYNEIWDKISNTIKERFESESVYNEKYLITKIKSYEGKSAQILLVIKMLKEGSQCICLSVMLIDSIFRLGKN